MICYTNGDIYVCILREKGQLLILLFKRLGCATKQVDHLNDLKRTSCTANT